jgi:HlyD family secretion protein
MSLNIATQAKTKTSTLVGAGMAGAIALAVLTVSVGGYWLWTHRAAAGSETDASDRLFTVNPMRMEILVSQMGELQAVDNIELISKVEGRATITNIVKEGAYVKQGDILVELDSSVIRQQIDDLSLEIQRQDAAVANAREMLAIQQSNNAAELEGATVALQLAEVDLQKYVEGTFPQESKSSVTKLEMAKIDLANKQDELAQAKSLFTRGFVTAADVKKADLAVTQANNAVQEADTALRVLQEYTHRADLAGKQNAVAQAKSKVERVRRQNESMIIQKNADLNSAEQQLQMRQRRMELLKSQLEACTIRAPDDGMVVYSNNPDNQSVIQEGAEVRERQPIIRLPDTRQMKVVLKLNESQANRVQPGMRATVAITGLPEDLNGTVGKVSIVPVSGNRWTNPDSKDYPAEILLDETPTNLKPSTSARTSIMIKTIENALAVRLESIYAIGNKAFVFVASGERIEPREIKVGDSSLTHAAVTSGLKEGERVLILEAGQGKRLLEAAGIKIGPAPQPSGPRNAPYGPGGPGVQPGAQAGGPSANQGIPNGGPAGPGGAPGMGGARDAGATGSTNGTASGERGGARQGGGNRPAGGEGPGMTGSGGNGEGRAPGEGRRRRDGQGGQRPAGEAPGAGGASPGAPTPSAPTGPASN